MNTLLNRPAGTKILPENQQAYELSMLDYIKSIELISTNTLVGNAYSDTVPIQPSNSRVCYIAGVNAQETVTFDNFFDLNGDSIVIVNQGSNGLFVILIWDTESWTAYTFETGIVINNYYTDDLTININFLAIEPFTYNVPQDMILNLMICEGTDATLSIALNTEMPRFTKLTITPTAIGLVILKGKLL